MQQFILNSQLVKTDQSKGMTLLDFIRYNQHLLGTKIGCREGDCGACTALIGTLKNGRIKYESMTSCITPLGNVEGKHVITVEGLNMDNLSPIQRAMVNHSGTQCGFCTPGFVVSLSGYCLSELPVSYENVIQSIDGNICRCTGYKSIERAAQEIFQLLMEKDINNPIGWSVQNGFVPSYFENIPERLEAIQPEQHLVLTPESRIVIGGGTDLYVQRHDDLHDAAIDFVFDQENYNGIEINDLICSVGGATTASDLLNNQQLREMFPSLRHHLSLVSSTPIRNMGTIAGNLVNASPIGDLTAFFVGLDAAIVLKELDSDERTIKLKDFYKGYKELDKKKEELIVAIRFPLLNQRTKFNFQKVSKRTYLDIASVNSAMRITVEKDHIEDIHISAGGVGPTPKFLTKTCLSLKGKRLTKDNVREALTVVQEEISPISDIRGAEEYKRLALRQLVYGHFVELFPDKFKVKDLV